MVMKQQISAHKLHLPKLTKANRKQICPSHPKSNQHISFSYQFSKSSL